MQPNIKPVDIVSIVFIGLLASLTAVFHLNIPHWHWLLLRYVLLIITLSATAWYVGTSHTWRPAGYLHIFLPVLIVPVVFDSLGDLIPWIRPHLMDDILIKIDHAIFGVHPTVWLERFVHPVVTVILQIAYITYYPMAIVLGIVLVSKGRMKEFDEAVFGIILCFYLSYIGYILVPALGPRFALAHAQTRGLDAGAFVLAIQDTLNALENTKTDAFPSGHTAIALMTLYYAWKFNEKTLTILLVPTVSLLIISTVYLRYHYVIDVIAGVLLTAGTIPLTSMLYRKTLRSSKRS